MRNLGSLFGALNKIQGKELDVKISAQLVRKILGIEG